MSSTSFRSDLLPFGYLPKYDPDWAIRRFYQIIAMFENDEIEPNEYNRAKLVRLTYEYCCNQWSKDMFLTTAFDQMGISLFEEYAQPEHSYKTGLYSFADSLMDSLFNLCKVSSENILQPTTAAYSDCLIRDRHRCVVSGKFDVAEAMERHERYGQDDAVDDDGTRLFGTGYNLDHLVVTNIIPQCLVSRTTTREMVFENIFAQSILFILDNEVSDWIDENGPSNALTLTTRNLSSFRNFQMFFEPAEGAEHTYAIKTFLPPLLNQPITRTLFLAKDRKIDSPSVRLFALHRAVAHILHLSDVGHYIDRNLHERSIN